MAIATAVTSGESLFFVFKHKFRICSSPNYCTKGALRGFKAEVLGHCKALTLYKGPLNKKTEAAVWEDHPISPKKLLGMLCVHYVAILSTVLWAPEQKCSVSQANYSHQEKQLPVGGHKRQHWEYST